MNNDLQSLFGGVPFDPNSVKPARDFDVLPPGKYSCLIESAEVKPTKAKTGYGLQLKLLVVDGPSKNRKLNPWINLQNLNAMCEEIGRREFSALCLAVGFSATDTMQLINKMIVAHVKVKDDQNDVRTYSAAGATTPASRGEFPSPVTAPDPVAPVPLMGSVETYASPQQSTVAPQPTVVPTQTARAPAPTPTSPAPVQSQSTAIAPAQAQAPQQPARPWDRK